MDYKVGDNLLCKYSDQDNDFITVGCYYNITYLSGNLLMITDDDGDDNWFSVGDDYDVRDYFYNPNELRKLKLEKLCSK